MEKASLVSLLLSKSNQKEKDDKRTEPHRTEEESSHIVLNRLWIFTQPFVLFFVCFLSASKNMTYHIQQHNLVNEITRYQVHTKMQFTLLLF